MVSQSPTFWLKAAAAKNIPSMLVTSNVFQLPIGWLKKATSVNIQSILVTLDVSQSSMSLSKSQ